MNKKLSDPWFEAAFIKDCNVDGSYRHLNVDGSNVLFKDSQGLFFYCPCGYGTNTAHANLIIFKNPPCGIIPPVDFGPSLRNDPDNHPRWTVNGDSINNLSLTPSIDVGNDSCWHGHITNGEITK